MREEKLRIRDPYFWLLIRLYSENGRVINAGGNKRGLFKMSYDFPGGT
jgi:hypothetical protein